MSDLVGILAVVTIERQRFSIIPEKKTFAMMFIDLGVKSFPERCQSVTHPESTMFNILVIFSSNRD